MKKIIIIFLAVLSLSHLANDLDINEAAQFFLSPETIFPVTSIAPKKDRFSPLDASIIDRELQEQGRITSDFFNEYASVYGGKGVWMKVLEYFSPQLDFEVPRSSYVAISDIWNVFLADAKNSELLNKANRLSQEYVNSSEEDRMYFVAEIDDVINSLNFSDSLDALIEKHAEIFKKVMIARSSGSKEDSFIQNLAGIFSSEKGDKECVTQLVKKVLHHYLRTIWVDQYDESTLGIDGVPKAVDTDNGLAFVFQDFINFESAGTAKTIYGYTCIESVFGDASYAVDAIEGTNTVNMMVNNQTGDQEFFFTYQDLPLRFKLEGVEYDIRKDKEKMRQVLEQRGYTKSEGTFCPVSAEMIDKLYQVIRQLEEKIGVALDVEWGFKEGRLYITQIRPVIGAFDKPLIKRDQSIAEKKEIAKTSIAEGQLEYDKTSLTSKGFTGKMVLFGDDISVQDVEKIEAELGEKQEGYIRVQKDVPSKVRGHKTSAKVLVDLSQGRRQAHNINFIDERISQGEFVYCNGPWLKEGFSSNLRFIPHPEIKGAWISAEDVTFFSDGLKGSFYVDDTNVSLPNLSARQRALINFQNVPLNDINDSLRNVMLFFQNVFSGQERLFVGQMRLLEYALSEAKNSEEIKVFEEYLDSLHPGLELLAEALSCPLIPEQWENPLLSKLQQLLILKEGIPKKDPQKASQFQTNNKFTVLYVNDSVKRSTPVKNTLQLKLGLTSSDAFHYENEKYNVFFADSLEKALEILNTTDINLLITDWELDGDAVATPLFDKALQKQMKAIAIDSLVGEASVNHLVTVPKYESITFDVFPEAIENGIDFIRKQQQEFQKNLPAGIINEAIPSTVPKQQAMIILNDNVAQARGLSDSLRDMAPCEIITVDDFASFASVLERKRPLVIIATDRLYDESKLDDMCPLIPKIIIQKDASSRIADKENLLGVVDPFFNFQKIKEIIKKKFYFSQGVPSSDSSSGIMSSA